MIWTADGFPRRWRRAAGLFALLLGLAGPSGADASTGSADAEPSACTSWSSFKTRFIAASGRVVDTANGDISHSEGQGYALILAAAHGDTEAFARVYGWTHRHLMLRDDGLLVWKWSPETAAHYPDANSAGDGDLLVAYGLLLGGDRFDAPAYTQAGERLAHAIKTHLVRAVGPYTVLLPGPKGFVQDDGSVFVNPSYWVFPALERIARHTGDPVWRDLDRSGRDLLRTARFGAWDLPPDWLALSASGLASLPPAERWAPVFGYNAMRVPLYLAWADAPMEADLLKPFRAFWAAETRGEGEPVVWDLVADEARERWPNPAVRAIRDLIADPRGPAGPGPAAPPATTHYYEAVLVLLACLAKHGDTPCPCAT
jgi:endoglucanase